jgi:hypothetical protein
MIWTDCPVKWPKDGKTPLSYSTVPQNYKMARDDDQPSELDRKNLASTMVSRELDCMYGVQDTKYQFPYHLTVELPLPVVQCGWHRISEGKTFGCRSLKTNPPIPTPEPIFPEKVSADTTLEGFGLGWTYEQIVAFANQQQMIVIGRLEDKFVRLHKDGLDAEIVFDPSINRSKEVIVDADWQDVDGMALHTKAVKQFGFQMALRHLDAKQRDGQGSKEVWESDDKKIAVEFWLDHRPEASASLHLIDKR